jgi:antitoxin (DNA-binding transcriptional repressor) of toxin-antitoxin stability system
MQTVSPFDAKTPGSRLIDQIATGAEAEIVISRNGKPVARVVRIQEDVSCRIGLAKGEFKVPDDINEHKVGVAALFLGGR